MRATNRRGLLIRHLLCHCAFTCFFWKASRANMAQPQWILDSQKQIVQAVAEGGILVDVMCSLSVFVVFWLNLNRSCFVQFNLFSSCHCCNLVRKRVRYFGALVNQGKLLEVGDDRCSQKLYPWLLESPDKMLALLISLFAQRRTSFNSYLERVAWIIKILPRPRQKCRKIPPRNQI
jgi:hypothetical protein